MSFFCFYDVLHGAIKINSVEIRLIIQNSLRPGIGTVLQSATMFNDTIRANVINIKWDSNQEELEQVMRDSQLEDFIDSFPLEWDTIISNRDFKFVGREK